MSGIVFVRVWRFPETCHQIEVKEADEGCRQSVAASKFVESYVRLVDNSVAFIEIAPSPDGPWLLWRVDVFHSALLKAWTMWSRPSTEQEAVRVITENKAPCSA